MRLRVAIELCSSYRIANSWEVVNDSAESFTSLKDARTSLTSERADGFVMGKRERVVDERENDAIDKVSATQCNEHVSVGT